jgi:hypothetical protein
MAPRRARQPPESPLSLGISSILALCLITENPVTPKYNNTTGRSVFDPPRGNHGQNGIEKHAQQ